MKRRNQKGFTIIELMIATGVFTVVLLIATFAIVQVGRAYYKGVSSSKTQNIVRTVIDDISQSVQLSAGTLFGSPQPTTIGPGISYFCTQQKRYIFAVGNQLLDSVPGSHVLMVDDQGTAAIPFPCPTPNVWPPGGTEMLQNNMRLAAFDVNNVSSTNLYNIRIRVVYGENDLVCSPTQGNCQNNTATTFAPGTPVYDLTCKGKNGAQFCGVADLSTSVEKRLQ